MPVLFPIHPRTAKRIQDFGLSLNNLRTMDPLGYLEFLNLESTAAVVLTDSGGAQEETTILGVPCLTLRHNTERPVTIAQGTNVLVGPDKKRILEAFRRIVNGDFRPAGPPEYLGRPRRRTHYSRYPRHSRTLIRRTSQPPHFNFNHLRAVSCVPLSDRPALMPPAMGRGFEGG